MAKQWNVHVKPEYNQLAVDLDAACIALGVTRTAAIMEGARLFLEAHAVAVKARQALADKYAEEMSELERRIPRTFGPGPFA
jgi:hypothetical protein